MWIVRLALRRPYTFVVAAILVAILGVFMAGFKMATDIFPTIDIPVISICFNYVGMSPDDVEKRLVTPYERILTTTVNNIEHIESQSIYGVGVIKVFFQPGANIAEANAQITAIAQTALRSLPQGTQPPLILQYSASQVPVIQLSLNSDTLPEQSLFDLAFNAIRPNLISIPGVQIPYPYGGKQRAVMVDLAPEKMYAWGISAADVSAAIGNQNLILPSGTVKIGTQEYQVRLNGSPTQVDELNRMPVKSITNSDGTHTTVFIKDIAHVRDGFQVQTNLVHSDGKRAVLMPIYKTGDASTLAVVDAVKAKIPYIEASLPPAAKGLKITPLFDQSIFVRASVQGVLKEAAIAAGLTGLMILLFLGSWRSTLIVVVSIPLSILVSIIVLGLLGQTLNTMTLGGMALAVGILVDDATVEIENIHRNLHMRKRLVKAILDGAQQIAVPAFVSTLCICIVFVPVVFISGAAKFLFTPLAMSVVFAMLTSYLLSRTLVPTMVHYLLAAEVEMYGGELDPNDPHAKAAIEHERHPELPVEPPQRHPIVKIALIVGVALVAGLAAAVGYTPLGSSLPAAQQGVQTGGTWAMANPRLLSMIVLAAVGLIAAVVLIGRYQLIWRLHYAFNRQFERAQRVYGGFLAWALAHRPTVVIGFTVLVVVSLMLFLGVGQDFFPTVDAGQIRLHVRTPAGTRIEQTERYYAQVQNVIRDVIPADEIVVILDNIGIPNSSINLSLSDGSVNAPAEGEVLVSLGEGHKPTAEYIRQIRNKVVERIPDLVVWSAPADIATQVLNFGLPASIDVQVTGPAFVAEQNRQFAAKLNDALAKVPGVSDRRIQQVSNTPDLRVTVDRALADQIGVTQKDVANDLLISLSSTNQISPNFWLSPQNGVSYPINVQTPQYKIGSLNDLTNTPIIPTGANGNAGTGMDASDTNAQLLGNLATIGRSTTPSNITHYDVNPTYDVLLGVEHQDLATVAKRVNQVIDQYRKDFPKASKVLLRGQVQSMQESFTGLAFGLIFAIVLVYLLMVINFQSWLDPLIILMALPGAASGILWMLWASHTTISVPSLMGAMMSIGVATSNSILMITFANDQRKDFGQNAHDAAFSAGVTRLRPVVMTALAMIIGMLPMSLGLGEGGEQNAPLGRAVIGGLLMATFSTLIFVPVVYSLLRDKPLVTQTEPELQES